MALQSLVKLLQLSTFYINFFISEECVVREKTYHDAYFISVVFWRRNLKQDVFLVIGHVLVITVEHSASYYLNLKTIFQK